jgi:integrase
LDDWLENIAPRRVGAKALERYSGLVRNQIKPHFATIELQKLRPLEISKWLETLIAAGDRSTRSTRHTHGVLRTALNHAAAVEIIERNVATIIRSPGLQRVEIEISTSDQIATTLEKMRDHPSMFPIVALATATAARRGEIAALTWAGIDLQGANLRIERALE